MSSWSIAQANLTSVGVLGFIFGFLASRVKSDVRIPDAIYQFLSIYLLIGIGLKGGHSLRDSNLSEIFTPSLTTVACGIIIPLLAFFILAMIKNLSAVDRGSIAAHYGSTSLVTFSAALLFLESNKIFVEGYAPALLTVMEIPGLVVGIFLASRSSSERVGWGATLKEVLLGKTVLLLVGGLFIGFITSNSGYEKVSPFFVDLLNGFLVLFLLHLGYLAGSNFGEIKKSGSKTCHLRVALSNTRWRNWSWSGNAHWSQRRWSNHAWCSLCERFLYCSPCCCVSGATQSKPHSCTDNQYRNYISI